MYINGLLIQPMRHLFTQLVINFEGFIPRYEFPNSIDAKIHLTHRGRVTHVCVSKLTIVGSDNGLSPGRRQAIIWTNDEILLIRTFRTHFSEIVSEIYTSSLNKMHFKMSSGKWRPSCLSLNVLNNNWDYGITQVVWLWHCNNMPLHWEEWDKIVV